MDPTHISAVADLGQAVRARRKEAGLTLVEAAERVEVGVRFLSELENGKPTVRLDKVLQVLEAFGLKLQIGETPSPPAANERERDILREPAAGEHDTSARRAYDLDDVMAEVKGFLGIEED